VRVPDDLKPYEAVATMTEMRGLLAVLKRLDKLGQNKWVREWMDLYQERDRVMNMLEDRLETAGALDRGEE